MLVALTQARGDPINAISYPKEFPRNVIKRSVQVRELLEREVA
jgi:hypothetical protein